MRERTRQCRLEEAFRQELFRLINHYVNSPEDATLGKIVATLVNFQQIRAAAEELCQRTCVAVLSGASVTASHTPCRASSPPPGTIVIRAAAGHTGIGENPGG